MSNGDIWFLLIFIILPTAVLVSGFWALLFVHRDPRKTIPQRRQRRAAEAKSTRDDVEETVQVATIPTVRAESEPIASDAPVDEAAELGPAVPVAGPTANELASDADGELDAPEVQPEEDRPEPEPEGEVQGPAPVELPDDEEASQPVEPAAQAVDDERLIELIDVDDRDDLMAEIERRRETQPARLESSTDEIPDLGEALSEPARLSEAGQHEEWRRPGADEPADAEATDWEISDEELEDDVEVEDESDADTDEESENQPGNPDSASGDNRRYRRRRPRVKLLPSDNGERQERRGRLAGRRKSGQERPSRRDKGGM